MKQTRTQQAAILADGLEKQYGSVRALDGLSFAVAPGTIFGLLGPNGAGKSTAVKILTTLSTADAGRAVVAGYDVRRQPEKVRRVIGCVAQQSGVDINATAYENLILQGQLHGLSGRTLKQQIERLLDRFDLTEAAHWLARTYSGGMRRRLDIALGLVHRPQVLFLDEPTTGLDPEIRAAMWQEIARLAQAESLTILLTTHYLEEADRLAARLAIMDRGRVVVEGTPAQLKSELRGDTLQIELQRREAAKAAQAALASMSKLHEMTVNGRHLRARLENGAQTAPQALQALAAQGIGVASVTVAQPSLDDVYLQYTGRTFAQAEGMEATP